MLKSFTIPALIAISFTFVNPCSSPKDNKPGADDTVFDVVTTLPEFQSVPKVNVVDGTFDVSEVNHITANADGKIDQVFVSVGDTVNKDDPLVSINSSLLLEQIDIKRAKIKELQARLGELTGRLELSGGEDQPATIDDTMFLDEDPVDAPADKQYGDANAQNRPKSLKGLVEVIEAQIDSLNKQADALDRKLLDMTQNSPVNGVVTNILTTPGNTVKQQDKLIEISTTDPMSVTFFLPDDVANFIDKSSKVKVSPVDAAEVSGSGTVYFISPNIDMASKKIEVKAHASNTDGKIKGGQKASVRVATRKMDRVIMLPKKALYYEEGKSYVFIAFRNQAKLVEVTLGDEDESGNVQVFGDLRVDDPIIIDRPVDLKHNSFIKTQQ